MAATTTKAAQTVPVPPGIALFMAGLRWQESGSPAGNYTEPNGQGAYQIIQSNWPAWALKYARYNTTDPNASNAPREVQNQVAFAKLSEYYYGPGERNWRVVARIWNGGSPNPVPNPALGAGATTDTYATQLLAKVALLKQRGYTASLDRSGGPADLAATAAAVYGTGPACLHQLHIPIKFAPDLNFCMDKPLALLGIGAGGLLTLTGVVIILVGAFKETAAGRAAAGAVGTAATVIPIARAARAARSITPARRAAAAQTRQASETRRLAPVLAEQRRQQSSAAAESRRAAAFASSEQRRSAAEARRRTDARRRGQLHRAELDYRRTRAKQAGRTRTPQRVYLTEDDPQYNRARARANDPAPF